MSTGINENTSYEDFCKGLQDFISTNLETLKGNVTAYSYQGFSPKDVFKTLLQKMRADNVSIEDAKRDVVDMLTIFLARGPNMTKVKSDTIKGGDSAFRRVEMLIRRYDIKSSKPKASDITLPRLSMIFASITRNIYSQVQEQILNYPVTDNEISLPGSQELSFNFTPCLITQSDLPLKYLIAMSFVIHNIYQCYLTKKTSLRDSKSAPNYFPSATKFSLLACNGSLVSSRTKRTYADSYENLIRKVGIDPAISAIKAFFIELPNETSEEVTAIHYIVNHIKLYNYIKSCLDYFSKISPSC